MIDTTQIKELSCMRAYEDAALNMMSTYSNKEISNFVVEIFEDGKGAGDSQLKGFFLLKCLKEPGNISLDKVLSSLICYSINSRLLNAVSRNLQRLFGAVEVYREMISKILAVGNLYRLHHLLFILDRLQLKDLYISKENLSLRLRNYYWDRNRYRVTTNTEITDQMELCKKLQLKLTSFLVERTLEFDFDIEICGYLALHMDPTYFEDISLLKTEKEKFITKLNSWGGVYDKRFYPYLEHL